jgi:hypothetical protein
MTAPTSSSEDELAGLRYQVEVLGAELANVRAALAEVQSRLGPVQFSPSAAVPCVAPVIYPGPVFPYTVTVDTPLNVCAGAQGPAQFWVPLT